MTDTVKVNLVGEFTAQQLKDVLAKLAIARSEIKPSVPTELPSTKLDNDALHQEDTLFSIQSLASGGMRIWIRNEGFGWLAFSINARDRKNLANFLSNKTSDTYTLQ